MNLKQINSIKDIPKFSRVGIYGCGETGRDLFKIIKDAREDIIIEFFIDSMRNDILFDLDVLKYDDSNFERINSAELIIIASAFWSTIYKGLTAETLSKSSILSSYFIYSNSQLNSLGDFYFDTDELKQHKQYFQKIEQRLQSDEERDLFKALINLRSKPSDYAPEFFLSYAPKGTPYIDYGMTDFHDVIIEAGTFDGTDTIRLANSSPKAKIYSFEPNPQTLKQSLHYSRIQKNPNIVIIEKALDQITGIARFNDNGSQSSKNARLGPDKGIYIESITLDEFVIKENISNVDFIKMDIEGGEIPALMGGASTIIKHKPKIAVSLYHRKADFYEIPAILDELIGSYTLRLGHYSSSFVDSVLYVIPN